jgi:acyl-CoA reductase-like NAD-dependent aldehyde dehydrogenase
VLKEPYGVVGAIVPWNYPLLLLSWKLAPALAAGNTVVIKPSELTSLVTLEWIERCFDHFPPGVINVVTGTGHQAGEALVHHPDVRVIAMTGSVATGQRIASVAAPMMKHLHLELGGKDAFVVAPDADVASAVQALRYSALINAGQVCTSSERVFVPRGMRDEFAESLASEVGALRLGHGLEPGTDLGPLAAAPFREKVASHVRDAVDRGAGCSRAAGSRTAPATSRADGARRRRRRHDDHERGDLRSDDPDRGLRRPRRRHRPGQRVTDGARRHPALVRPRAHQAVLRGRQGRHRVDQRPAHGQLRGSRSAA